MSTKTTFKRVALVTVAALGFGVLTSVAPASAAVSTGLSLSASSITVVGGSAGSAKALVAVTVSSDTASTGLGAGETVTASVIGVPNNITTTRTLASSLAANSNAGELTFLETKGQTSGSDVSWSTFTADTPTDSSSTTDGAIQPQNTGFYNLDHLGEDLTTAKYRTYFMAIKCDTTCMDQGVYTVAFDLYNAGGAIVSRQTVKIDFVTLAASSGAVLTASATGAWFIGNTPSVANMTSTKKITGTITNRDGGPIRANDGTALAVTATIADSSTVPVIQTLSTANDSTNEYGYSATAADRTSYANDSSFTIYSGSAFTAVTGPGTITVRYGLSSATASVTLNAAATAGTTAVASIVAAGQIDSTDAATVPLTTKAVTVSAKVTDSAGAKTGYAMYYTYAYGASCSAGDMTTKVSTPTKVLTDASGIASVAIANAYPLTGCTATVTWVGATTDDSAQVITWAKAAAASAIPSPGGNVQVALKSTNKTTWTIVDQFGAVVAGATVQISHAGSNAPTVAPATVVSDANGQVSYSFTDALAVAAGTDTVKVATVNTVAPSVSLGAIVYTYKTTLDVVASLESTYTITGGSAVLVPTTVIAGAAGTGIVASGIDAIDWTKAQTTATVGALTGVVALNFTAKSATPATVSGIPTTVTVTNGLILGSDGKPTTTRTIYANETIYVIGAKTGVAVVTATNGTVTKTASILFVNASTDARVISAAESAGKITAKAVDWNGNPVAGVLLDVTTTGTGNLGNGASFAQFTTSADGTVTFTVVGEATVTIKSNVTNKTLNLAGYSDATGTNVTTGVAAGVRSVSIATGGVADVSQAAADAAAEATDAANAATDAANAAAEAADAATAAAQDSADAVAALSTQVSEMISALKKQITALTNLVIKIQKKVKA